MGLGMMTAALLLCEMFPVAAQPVPPAAPPAPLLPLVQARGVLRACIWPEAYGFSWRDPRGDRLEGLGIEVAQALATRLGVGLRLVEIAANDFTARLARRDCDVAVTTLGITPARARQVAFGRPYLASPVYAVVPRDSRRIRQWEELDRVGAVVAVSAGSAHETLMRDLLRDAQLLVLRPPAQREQEVLAGRADAFIAEFPFALRMRRTRDWARVIEPPPQLPRVRYALAVPLGEGEWLAALDAVVAALRADGSLARAATRHGLEPMLLP
jgi:ABC-type amino acid transport substrate-binding protein